MKQNNQINAAYKYTNKVGYTTAIYVVEINDKSVFYFWYKDGKPWGSKARMSINTFSKYSLLPAKSVNL